MNSNGFNFQMKKRLDILEIDDWKKKSMWTKLNKQKYAHKNNRLVASCFSQTNLQNETHFLANIQSYF